VIAGESAKHADPDNGENLYLRALPTYVSTLAPTSGPHGTLPTHSLDILDLDFVLRQSSQHANSLACKCFGFVLIVEAVDRLLLRVEQNILRAKLRALDGAGVLVASHTLHFVHHFFVGAVFGAKRIHDFARECLRVGFTRLLLRLCLHEWRSEKQPQTNGENDARVSFHFPLKILVAVERLHFSNLVNAERRVVTQRSRLCNLLVAIRSIPRSDKLFTRI